MNIWMLNHYATPERHGLSSRHAVLARHLQGRGHRVTVFASAIAHRANRPAATIPLPDGVLYKEELIESVRWRFVRTRPYSNTWQRLRNMHSFRTNVCRATAGLKRPDVIIGSCVHPYAVDAARRLAKRYRCKFVYEIRDIWPESLLDLGAITRWNPVYWDLRRIEKLAFRSADGVIVLFPGMQAYTDRHGVSRDRLCYLPNGIDPALYRSVQSPPKSNPFVVSFLGTHGPANGLDTVVQVAARLQSESRGDILIRLVGDGTRKDACMKMAQKLRLDNIEFREPVPKNELGPLAQASHAFLFCPTPRAAVERYGISPNKLFDYLVNARPIIFSCRSFNNPVEEARAGISVPPGDPDALARAIVELRDMPLEQRERMGINGRRYALEHHDLAKLAGRLEDFLCNLAGEAARGPHDEKQKAA